MCFSIFYWTINNSKNTHSKCVNVIIQHSIDAIISLPSQLGNEKLRMVENDPADKNNLNTNILIQKRTKTITIIASGNPSP